MASDLKGLDWRAILSAVAASMILTSGSIIYAAGQAEEKFNNLEKDQARTTKDLSDLKTTFEGRFSATDKNIETRFSETDKSIEGLKNSMVEFSLRQNTNNGYLQRIEETLGDIKDMGKTVNGLDTKVTQVLVAQGFITEDMRDFKARIKELESRRNGGE